MYKVSIKNSALKEIQQIPKDFRIKIIETIDSLANNPRPGGVKKLENFRNSYRVRVGQYRIVYEIEDRQLVVEVIKVGNRKEVYRNK
ncbi:type II toxin-antitoxin system RelE family toxin [Dyadobacter jiangsuensis]|uniref:mRNA interferase RelE/StbE n=1 Tax=Dyadobacter jiangsuensis TaxID=1591085 RepID=A0A2P8FDS7_9BACT|nr:type II toxin-antitoxin system RelE/ParE family toxin [Dyadobacter jiangsuensis]PSL19866.1 mRNA interferase RelE/StbE [Dyadobacter jiangsuensis]